MSGTNITLIIVIVIVAIFAMVGLLDAVRGTPVKRVRVLGGGTLPHVRDPAFLPSMELACNTQFSEGNHAEFFWNGDLTYPRLWDDLRRARDSITFLMYYCKNGRMADTLVEILSERARAGISVFMLYDAWGSSWDDRYVRRLREAGVCVEKFRPITLSRLNVLNHRSHARVVCIDGRIGWTGGFGIDDKWFGDGRSEDQWRDSNVRFTGPAVSRLQAAFASCWGETTGDLLFGERLYPVNDENDDGRNGTLHAGLLHGSPSVGSTEAERFFALTIATARERLYITNSYFVPDRDFRKMFCEAAERGVDVRILTVGPKTDVKSTWYAGRARYERLLKSGVRIFEYQPTMIHAKTVIVDSHWCAVGSMNADNRSLSFNEETVLMMMDDGAAQTLEEHFHDDLRHSREILLDEFRKRGLADRVKELVCLAFWRVL